jgi:hypothetical protein
MPARIGAGSIGWFIKPILPSNIYRISNFTNENEKNRLLAEAYAMRAHLYYIMVRTWGDVPLVLDPTEGVDPDEIFRARTPAEEVFVQIKKRY